jgi:hydrogenase/urease accessory protein HupE
MNKRIVRGSVVCALTLFLPALARAHSANGALNGWHDGFSHPLAGWDHLLAMLAVGVWAAQQRGRAVWMLPTMFVSAMLLGGIAGASGLTLPGIETGIFGSVLVLLVLVLKRVRYKLSLGLSLVGLFGFCHGFAHGAEMPGSASLLAFGCGFVLATIMLHALGLLTARSVIALLACSVSGSTIAPALDHGRRHKRNHPASPCHSHRPCR